MKSLVTLIKLQKTRVDMERIHLATLLARLEQIDETIAQFEIQKARELEAAKDGHARATYGAFLKNAVAQGRTLESERKATAMAVQMAQAKLTELFEEQKRYEIAEDQRLKSEEESERRRERIVLDEVGGIIHERKKNT